MRGVKKRNFGTSPLCENPLPLSSEVGRRNSEQISHDISEDQEVQNELEPLASGYQWPQRAQTEVKTIWTSTGLRKAKETGFAISNDVDLDTERKLSGSEGEWTQEREFGRT